jgi:hypothetical protein
MNMRNRTLKTIAISLILIFIASIAMQAAAANAATSSAATFGYSQVGPYTDRTPPGDKGSCRYKAPQTGTITSVSMYIQTGNAQVRFGVYSDQNGQPSQLLAQSSYVSTGNGNNWITTPLTTPIVGGQYYWLTILSNSIVYWSFNTGGSDASAGNGKDQSSLSSSYGSFTSWGHSMFSIYATYTTSTSSSSYTYPASQPAATTTPTPTQTSTPSTSGVKPVWSTNGEISSLSQLGISNSPYGNGSPSDTVTITTAHAHSGSKSFKLTTVDSRIEFNMYPGSLIQNDFYYSWWVYVPSSMGLPSSGQWLTLFQIEGSNQPGWYPIGKLQLQPNSPNINLWWQDLSGHQTMLAASGVALPRDQWVHFQWYTSIGTNGRFQAWMNGAKLWDVSGINTSGLKTSTMYFMSDLYGMNGAYYVDDMALYNTNLNGQAP